MGAKKGGRKTSYYERQKSVTIRHKTTQALKRKRDKEKWLKLGYKKNGEPVLTAERKALPGKPTSLTPQVSSNMKANSL